MKVIHKSVITTLCLLLLFSSCTPSVNQRISDADRILINSPFKKVLVRSGNFVLTTYQKIRGCSLPSSRPNNTLSFDSTTYQN